MTPVSWQFASQTLELKACPHQGLLVVLKRGPFSFRVRIEGLPSVPYDKLVQVPFRQAFYPVVSRSTEGEWCVRFHVRGEGGCWDWLCLGGAKEDERPLINPASPPASYQEPFTAQAPQPRTAKPELSEIDAVRFAEKLHQIREKNLEMFSGEQELFVPLTATLGGAKRVELDERFRSFLEGPQKSLLLLGAGGSGKTSFCHAMARKLSQEKSKYIPIFVSLPSLKNPSQRLMNESLSGYAFDPQEREHLRTQPFVLFLDAFDEIRVWENLCETNRLGDWNVKVVFTCRPEYLEDVQANLGLFAPPTPQGPSLTLLQFLFLAPFSVEQVYAYLEKFIGTGKTKWKEAALYESAIERIPSLSQLITNPFILKIAAEALPQIYEAHQREHGEEQLQLTRGDLYRAFIDHWLQRKGANGPMQMRVLDFCRKLAQKMHEKEIYQVTSQEGLFDSVQEDWGLFFGNEHPETVNVRALAPLCRVGEHQWAFLHPSIRDFFVSETIFVQTASSAVVVESSPEIEIETLNQRLLVNDFETMRFLSEKASADPKLQQKLLEIVLRSKNTPQFAIAAANAISILNMSGFCFSGLDLTGVQIPYADLSGGVFHRTIFDQGNLDGVKLSRTFLTSTSFRGASMQNIQFGYWPYIRHEAQISYVQFLSDRRIFSSSADGKFCFRDLQAWGERIIERKLTSKKDKKILPVSNVKLSKDGKIGVEIAGYMAAFEVFATGKSVQIEQELPITTACISADNSMSALALQDGTIVLCQTATGIEVGTLQTYPDITSSRTASKKPLRPGHKAWVPGTYAATAPDTVTMVRSSTGKMLPVHFGYNIEETILNCLFFSLDGRRLFAAGNDNLIRVWDVRTKTIATILNSDKEALPVVLRRDDNHIEAMALHPNGRWLISAASPHPGIILWDLSNPQNFQALKGMPQNVTALEFSSSGRFLAVAEERTISLWDFETMEPIKIFQGHGDRIATIAFSPDEQLLASGGQNRSVTIWNIDFQSLYKTQVAFPDTTQTVMGPAEDQMISQTSDGKLIVWDPISQKILKTVVRGTRPGARLEMSSDRKLLAVYSTKSEVHQNPSRSEIQSVIQILNTETLEPIFSLQPDGRLLKCAFSYDSKWFIMSCGCTAEPDKMDRYSKIKLINMETREVVWPFEIGGGFMDQLAFAPGNDVIFAVSGSEASEIKVIERTKDGRVATSSFPSPPGMGQDFLTFLAPNALLMTEISDKPDASGMKLLIFNLEDDNARLVRSGYKYEIRHIALSPQKNLIAISGESIPRFENMHAFPKSVVIAEIFQSDSSKGLRGSSEDMGEYMARRKTLLSGGLTTPDSGLPIWFGMAMMGAHTEEIVDLSFSPSGKFLISTDANHQTAIWRLFNQSGNLKPSLYWRSSEEFVVLGTKTSEAKLSVVNEYAFASEPPFLNRPKGDGVLWARRTEKTSQADHQLFERLYPGKKLWRGKVEEEEEDKKEG